MKIEKSKILIFIVFLTIIICDTNGYLTLFNKIVQTISGEKTPRLEKRLQLSGIDDLTENSEPFILETNLNDWNIASQSSDFNNLLLFYKNEIEECFNDLFPIAKDTLININGGFQRLIGRSIVIDADVGADVIRLDNNYLARLHTEDLSVYIDRANEIIELNSFLETKNIPLVFSMVSYKIEKAEVPIVNIAVSNRKYMKDTIRNVGIPVIDWAEEMDRDGKEFLSMYYKTDHHWKAESGLWAAGVIAEFCKNQYNFPYDEAITNPQNYSYEVMENEFLGSQGKRVGKLYAGVDDFTIIHPNFETYLTSSTLQEDGEWEFRTGTLEEAMYWENHIAYRDYFAHNPDIVPYSMYSGGSKSIQTTYNINSLNDKRILIIRHSFANVMLPFLALSYRELNVVDLRHEGRPLNLYSYIEDYNPDLVLFIW
jgi:hypothetical protein